MSRRVGAGAMRRASATRRLVALLLLVAAPVGAAKDAPPPLRVMTCNILYATAQSPAGPWTERRPLAVAMVRRWSPDVIGLQEPTSAQLAEFASDLPEYGVVPGPLTGPNRMPV